MLPVRFGPGQDRTGHVEATLRNALATRLKPPPSHRPALLGYASRFIDTFGDVRVVVNSCLVSLKSGILSAVGLRYCHL